MTKFHISAAAMFALVIAALRVYAQESMPGMPGMAMDGSSPGTTNDLFVMAGSDVDRPGMLPRSNYSIGIGHMFDFLKKNPLGDELTFGYMYENSGTHGFLHTVFGEHTNRSES